LCVAPLGPTQQLARALALVCAAWAAETTATNGANVYGYREVLESREGLGAH